MEFVYEENESIDSWETVMFLYGSALKKVTLNMEILNDEFRYLHNYNPIEHIKSRLKEPESIVKKLKRHGYESTIENMVKYVKDIAGVRIICSFTSDIYLLADMIAKSNDVKVLEIRDYIRNPKPSGYTSYHMIVSTPINMGDRKVDTVVEIQIRTVAMDFWASLEHKIQYKFEGAAPEHMRESLKECADMAAVLDERMLALNESLQREEKKV